MYQYAPRSPLHRLYRYCRRSSLVLRRGLSVSANSRMSLNSLLNDVELWHGRTVLRSTPRDIQVGTNMVCNLRCNFCRLNQPATRESLHDRPFGKKEINGATLHRLLQLLPYAERVSLTPLGEPLLWSGLEPFLVRAQKLGCGNIELTSNGMLLETYVPLLSRQGVRGVTLSIDTNDPEVYAGMRIGGDLRQVERGVRLLAQQSPRPKITIASTFMRRNIEQLPSMVSWAKSLGADVLAVQLMEIENPEQEREHLRYSPDLTRKMLLDAIAKGDYLHYPVVVSEGMGRFLRNDADCTLDDSQTLDAHYYEGQKSMVGSLLEQCRDPWSSLLIDTDGDCRPCCWAGISYGNLSDGRSFGSVWNGDVAREVRRMFLANELPEGCRGRHCRVDV